MALLAELYPSSNKSEIDANPSSFVLQPLLAVLDTSASPSLNSFA